MLFVSIYLSFIGEFELIYLKIPFLHFEIYDAYEEMFSIVSEVKYLLEKGRDFPPSSMEKTKRVRKSRLSRRHFQDRTIVSFPEFEEGYMPVGQHLKRKKPIQFKDCLGRKFTFPFHLVETWAVRHTCSTLSSN
jgi:hypothetical protein